MTVKPKSPSPHPCKWIGIKFAEIFWFHPEALTTFAKKNQFATFDLNKAYRTIVYPFYFCLKNPLAKINRLLVFSYFLLKRLSMKRKVHHQKRKWVTQTFRTFLSHFFQIPLVEARFYKQPVVLCEKIELLTLHKLAESALRASPGTHVQQKVTGNNIHFHIHLTVQLLGLKVVKRRPSNIKKKERQVNAKLCIIGTKPLLSMNVCMWGLVGTFYKSPNQNEWLILVKLFLEITCKQAH